MPHRFRHLATHSSSSRQISVRYHHAVPHVCSARRSLFAHPHSAPPHHVCSSPVPAFINPTQPGKVAQCCLVLPCSLVLYRRRSLWEAFVQCNRNISPLIILGSSCGAGLTAKGVVRVFASRRWMRLRMICAWPTHSLRVVCASSAHRLRIVCEQSGNSAFGAMPGMSSLLVPGVRPSACENAASSTVACD